MAVVSTSSILDAVIFTPAKIERAKTELREEMALNLDAKCIALERRLIPVEAKTDVYGQALQVLAVDFKARVEAPKEQPKKKGWFGR